MRDYFLLFSIITSCLLLLACDKSGEVQDSESARVGDERLINADAEPHNWLNHGRTYTEQRFSPLEQINAENVAQLKLAWHLDLPSRRGLEATPLVVDGRMYTTGTWNRVYALDGRLIALDAMSGREVWSVQTTPSDRRYTITGAPRIVNGRVLIGNGGAEFDARGFVTAYDAATGEQVWRFYTVPGDPALPFENPILEQAVETWNGEWWKYGAARAYSRCGDRCFRQAAIPPVLHPLSRRCRHQRRRHPGFTLYGYGHP